MEDLKFTLEYFFDGKRWFHHYDLVKVDDNEFILKLVVRPSFSLKHLQELLFKLNFNVDNTLCYEQLRYKNLIAIKLRVWKDNPDDHWL